MSRNNIYIGTDEARQTVAVNIDAGLIDLTVINGRGEYVTVVLLKNQAIKLAAALNLAVDTIIEQGL